jgi:hypothetical protein
MMSLWWNHSCCCNRWYCTRTTYRVLIFETENTIALFDINDQGLASTGTVIPTGVVTDSEFDAQIGGRNYLYRWTTYGIKAFAKVAYNKDITILGRNPSFREFMENQYKFTENKNQ